MADRTRHLLGVAAALALSVGLAACGDDDGAAEAETDDDATFAPVEVPEGAEPYVDALVLELTSEPTLPIPDDQAHCIAGRMVQVFQLERLEAAGIQPDQLPEGQLVFEELELTDDEGLKLVDAFQQCDFDLYEAFLDSMVLGAAVDDEAVARRCLQNALSRDDLRAAMAESFVAGDEEIDDPEMDAMTEAMFTCVMGEDFEQIEGEL